MADILQIEFADGSRETFPKGTPLAEMAESRRENYASPVVAARVNNVLTHIGERLEVDAKVDFFDLRTGQGLKVYERSLGFVMIVAAHRLFPGKNLVVEHSLGDGVYCELLLGQPLTGADIKALERAMREIVAEDLPIERRILPLGEAVREFEACGYPGKARLLRQLERAAVSVYSCGGVIDYLYGPMVPRTGYLRHLSLKFYPPGFIMRFSQQGEPGEDS